MANRVVGQTGKVVLSDAIVKDHLGKNRIIRYRYEKRHNGWDAVVIGPFHSRMYGMCSFGTKRTSAKASLIRRLGNDYGYIGHLLFSDVDEADTVGNYDPRLLNDRATAHPITCNV